MVVRHRCLVAVSPRLLGHALVRLLPHDRLDVVVADADDDARDRGPFALVIASLHDERVPPAQVQVTVAPQGAEGPAVTVLGPGARRREVATVAALLPLIAEICDELAVGATG